MLAAEVGVPSTALVVVSSEASAWPIACDIIKADARAMAFAVSVERSPRGDFLMGSFGAPGAGTCDGDAVTKPAPLLELELDLPPAVELVLLRSNLVNRDASLFISSIELERIEPTTESKLLILFSWAASFDSTSVNLL